MVVVAVAGLAIGYLVGRAGDGGVGAQEVSPTKARARDFYVPNSEDLAADEMRIIACGTGMPTPRPAQAAACFLVELGNGDKFIFDMGEGSVERLWALEIPLAYLDKVFIGHLHGDHFGDLGAMFVAGALGGRHGPLRIWGPSGQVPELGTAYAVQMMENMFTWDIAGRIGQTDTRGFHTEVTEFDYKLENQVVYQENGVTIRAWPAIHAIDGPVSYGLEWNGLKFVFGSDTFPQQVVQRVCPQRRSGDSRVLRYGAGLHLEVASHARGGLAGRYSDPHGARSLREGDERDPTAHGGGLPLLQGLRHDRTDSRADPQDL